MHGRIDVHLNQPHLPAAVSEGRREGGREGGTYIELCVEHKVKSEEVKETDLVSEFVPDTLETGVHDCLHLLLQ